MRLLRLGKNLAQASFGAGNPTCAVILPGKRIAIKQTQNADFSTLCGIVFT
jgi:hypothetical protein